MNSGIRYFVILDDGETFSPLDGCRIVGIRTDNEAALDVLEREDFEELLDLADVNAPIEAPRP